MGLFGSPSEADEDVSGQFRPVDEEENETDERQPQWWVSARPRDDQFNGTLKRVVDEDAGVVIYAYTNGNAGGVTSVPLSQTELDVGSNSSDSDDADHSSN
ncbi:hypothetical protein AUR64_00180 [Haloprofundus marisrubri]|uniref:Uncharacterized protein n=1 Tax=Haloprofundus marisrubri TaxID=1514971 RepID=A0A0W1RDU2_9EURY|nr:hypothetical protein [Haloprofundus marisrubri]KTG11646.1 hypothetical protein AUR64_00180 [Haloprofundus marisrubri]